MSLDTVIRSEARGDEEAMAFELEEGVLRQYLDALEGGERLPGFCNWPVFFMLC